MVAVFVRRACCVAVWCLAGLYMLQPNQAALLLAVRQLPRHRPRATACAGRTRSTSKNKISVRAHNFNSEKLKVNDLRGNPIEIAAAIVWRVDDTAQASFDVENYEAYVLTQAESAVRHLALSYAYDNLDEPGTAESTEVTLRSGTERGRRRRCATSCSSASPRPASSSSTPSSPTSPTRPRSPARCCAGSRPRR